MTSALTIGEARRAIVRARASQRLSAKQERAAARALETFAARCDLVAISDDVLLRAGLGKPPSLVQVLTRDARIRHNAAAAGYATA